MSLPLDMHSGNSFAEVFCGSRRISEVDFIESEEMQFPLWMSCVFLRAREESNGMTRATITSLITRLKKRILRPS